MTDNHLPSIPDFYSGQRIFITGATGFLGKSLIEKLLRSCPDIHTIYILMRDKKGRESKYRFQRFLQDQVFGRVRAEHAEALSKIVIINGDLTSSHMGISESDQKLLVDKVSIVFHMAATVRFDEPLKKAASINIIGAQNVIDLCHKMKKLQAFVHVSTAYCNCTKKELDEIVYDSSVNPDDFLHTLRWMDDTLVEQITPGMLQSHPNTYTFTKGLAETLVLEKSGSLPMAILRPSIITPAWKEPYPGWIDNYNGIPGLIVAIGKGLLRTVYAEKNLKMDAIPIDVVSNEAIAVAWYTACCKPKETIVYNCTLGSTNKMYWEDLVDVVKGSLHTHPYHGCFLYPSINLTHSKLWNSLMTFFTMIIPFCIFDSITVLRGRQPKLMSFYKKIDGQIKTVWHFGTNEWNFRNNNTLQLMEKLSCIDKKVFNFDTQKLHWPTYFQINTTEFRRFLLKEEFSLIPEDRKKYQKIYIATKIGQVLVLYILWKTLPTILGKIVSMSLLVGMYNSTISLFLSYF